ncbi:MAG: hypothetical protein CMJ24_01335 [Phycisphaerae bacterium]|nr:hypothetical protein [Phycisphaerae bacterium]MDG1899473.1 peptidoglycan recognition family protein [Phycisphaerales bacterium]
MHPNDTTRTDRHDEVGSILSAASTRRLFILGSLALLAGCTTTRTSQDLPGVIWTKGATAPKARPTPSGMPVDDRGVIGRSTWAKGNPIPANMNRMVPVKRITVHHDGMDAFTSTSRSAAAARLERIRRSHLSRGPQKWGDIGYHYAIDPAGRVWECRPLTWQGAHVKNQNPGNLGILVMGNYDRQQVTVVQKKAIDAFISSKMRQYGVGRRDLHTHQELAPTACPGRSLQGFMVQARSSGTFG